MQEKINKLFGLLGLVSVVLMSRMKVTSINSYL